MYRQRKPTAGVEHPAGTDKSPYVPEAQDYGRRGDKASRGALPVSAAASPRREAWKQGSNMSKREKRSRSVLMPALALTAGLALCCASRIEAEGAAQKQEAPSVDEIKLEVPAKIPTYYNLAKQGKKPKVRSQGNTGTCWAFSAVSAIESDLLPDRQISLSADHMSLSNGFNATQDDGGDYYMIMSYLSDWKGPVLEEEDPYGDGESPEGLKPALHVQEVRLLTGLSHAQVKRVILEHGAVQSSLCLDRERTDTDDYHYYNALTGAYFDPLMENVDHDVLILGWDDDYSRENFRIKPRSDGAWICQNTWGESFGEDGIFYVSYEDHNLLRQGGAAYARIEDVDNYDQVYENDSLGWQGRQGYETEGCWFAGAFTAEEEEELAAVGIYSAGPGTTCSVYVIPDFQGAKDLKAMEACGHRADLGSTVGSGQSTDTAETGDSGQSADTGETVDSGQSADAVPQPVAERMMDTAGFFTIDLNQSIPLAAGQHFAVAVWIETPGEKNPVVVEMVKDEYTKNVKLEGRHTWVSADGKYWENTQKKYQTNVCLKAYTKRRKET